VLYGKAPPTIATYLPKTAHLQSVEDKLMDRDVVLQLQKDNLAKAQDRMKKYADKDRTEREFGVWDWSSRDRSRMGKFLLGGEGHEHHLHCSLGLTKYGN